MNESSSGACGIEQGQAEADEGVMALRATCSGHSVKHQLCICNLLPLLLAQNQDHPRLLCVSLFALGSMANGSDGAAAETQLDTMGASVTVGSSDGEDEGHVNKKAKLGGHRVVRTNTTLPPMPEARDRDMIKWVHCSTHEVNVPFVQMASSGLVQCGLCVMEVGEDKSVTCIQGCISTCGKKNGYRCAMCGCFCHLLRAHYFSRMRDKIERENKVLQYQLRDW